MQTAPGTYQGDIFDGGGACVPGSCNPRWIATHITVDGDVAREYYYPLEHANGDIECIGSAGRRGIRRRRCGERIALSSVCRKIG